MTNLGPAAKGTLMTTGKSLCFMHVHTLGHILTQKKAGKLTAYGIKICTCGWMPDVYFPYKVLSSHNIFLGEHKCA